MSNYNVADKADSGSWSAAEHNAMKVAINSKADQTAMEAAVSAAIDALITGAPGALDTLNELAAALGDDANFAATVTTALATKLPKIDPTVDGQLIITRDGSNVIVKPKTNIATDVNFIFQDFAGTPLGRLTQHTGTGKMLLETHPGAGTPEIELDYDNLKVKLRAADVLGNLDVTGFAAGFDGDLKLAQLMGSTVKGSTWPGGFQRQSGSAISLVDAQIFWAVCLIPKGFTLNDFKFWQNIQGVFDADNNNKIGIYSTNLSTALLTKIGETANSAGLWKNAVGAVTVPLSAPVVLVPGVYYVALIYHYSAFTTHPTIGAYAPGTLSGAAGFDLPNNFKFFGTSNAADLPATINMSSITGNNSRPAIYLA